MKDNEQMFKRILKSREFFSPTDLVNLGLFGSRSMVHSLISSGVLQGAYITDRRLVVFKDSLLKYLMEVESSRSKNKD